MLTTVTGIGVQTLLGDLLDVLIEEFEAELGTIDESDPGERLRSTVDPVVSSAGDTDLVRLRQPLMEIRGRRHTTTATRSGSRQSTPSCSRNWRGVSSADSTTERSPT